MRYGELREILTRTELAAAVDAGALVSVGHGVYALPEAEEHLTAAASLSGVLAGLSAAMFWGWKVKSPPTHPQVVVPRGRQVRPTRRVGVDVRWMDIAPQDRERGVLGQVATALDCARTLPLDEALAVIESVLRAVLLDVVGLDLVPQVWVSNIGRADLVDKHQRLVVEADSFEFHSGRAEMKRDMERYNAFVAEGYTVLRFAWEHAMFEQEYVRQAVIGVLRDI